MIFHTLFQTWLSKCIPYFRPYVVRQIWQVYGVRDFVMPQTMFVFFDFAINVHGSTRYSKNGIPDQIDGIYTLFQTKMAKSIPYIRPFGAAHTYMAYMWEYPPPPPPLPPGNRVDNDFSKTCFHQVIRQDIWYSPCVQDWHFCFFSISNMLSWGW